MIQFEKISIKNFMSVGNAPIDIDYTSHETTIITASNGAGKSSIMLDSITFALFGKPYRNINKAQLINSVNQKECMVELWFKVNKIDYRIKRGIKPNIFEIYKDDKLLNQDAAARDYQKLLEQGILKMNYRTFTQVVIMGSGNYIPFMRLPLIQRREFIEDILDIKIFSIMNQLLKQKIVDNKDEMKDLDSSIKAIKEKIKMQEEFIGTLESSRTEQIEEYKKSIDSLMSEIDEANNKIIDLEKIEGKITSNIEIQKPKNTEYKNIKIAIESTQSAIRKLIKEKDTITSMEDCPTCRQSVEDSHKEIMISFFETKISQEESLIADSNTKLDDLAQIVKNLAENQTALFDLNSKIGEINSTITAANRIIVKYNQEIENLQNNSTSVDTERDKLKLLAKDILFKSTAKTNLNEQSFYYDVAAALLKDTGIKTKIIKQYLPMMNSLINKFLHQLDFFVSFNLDDNFNEVVKSRHRDTFTYESFSEGEKQRLDLALLFTFREISRMKNSLHCNLLLLDETLDASLDVAGVDNFFNILDTIEKSNVFVISHREGMGEKFDKHIHLAKRGNFTEIAEIE